MSVTTRKNIATVGKIEVGNSAKSTSAQTKLFLGRAKKFFTPLPFFLSLIAGPSFSYEILKMKFEKRPFHLKNVIKTWSLLLKIKDSYYK